MPKNQKRRISRMTTSNELSHVVDGGFVGPNIPGRLSSSRKELLASVIFDSKNVLRRAHTNVSRVARTRFFEVVFMVRY